MTECLQPIILEPNRPERPYRGGEGIDDFRGDPRRGGRRPEDFVGSTTEVWGGGAGLTVLADGRSLRDAVEDDPVGFLGAKHAECFGPDPRLLVKLLDTGERLFVHLHPDDEFAAAHQLGDHGKTEAWIVLATRGEAVAHLGFSRDVDENEVVSWIEAQDVDAMLAAMNRVELRAGDTIAVPAGVLHSIGAGVTLAELQQPADLSILLEYERVEGVDAHDAFLGLPREVALQSLRRSRLAESELGSLLGRVATESGARALFPALENHFRAEWISGPNTHELDAGFGILIVVEGEGALLHEGGRRDVRRGQTLLVPHGAGPVRLEGGVSAVLCRPPAPRHVLG